MRWWVGLFLAVFGSAHASERVVSVGEPGLVFTLPAINEALALEAVGQSRVSLDAFVGLLPTANCGRDEKGCAAVLLFFFDRQSGADRLKALNQVTKRFGDRGVRVLAVSQDESSLSEVSEWVQDQQVNYIVLRDNFHVLSERYGLSTWPMLFVLDEAGRVASIGAPPANELFSSVESALLPLVGGR